VAEITFLTDGIWPSSVGGMQIYAFNLVRALAQRGVYVNLVLPTGQLKSVASEFKDEERKYVSFLEVDFPRLFRFPFHYLVESYLYSKNIFYSLQEKGLNSSFIFCQGFSGWFLLRHRNRFKARIGVHFHGYEMYQQQYSIKLEIISRLFRSAVQRNLMPADIIFSLGGRISDIINGIVAAPDKIFELPVGVFPDQIVGKPRKTNKVREFVFVGRFEKRKGVENLNKALTMIEDQDFLFHFVGPIPDKFRLKNSKYRYYGLVKDREFIYGILDRADFLVLPSLSEGMPTVILEAMARGLAVIATSVGGVSLLVDEANGFLIPKNDINALVGALVQGVELDDEELVNLKTASISKVRRYEWPTIADRLITLCA
jgi:glycosyltransferase involved in cell wall biosynthesis